MRVRCWGDGKDKQPVRPEFVHAEEFRAGERPVLFLGTLLCLLIRFLDTEVSPNWSYF